MSEQYPISGGKMVIKPDGTSTYVRFHDRPQTADETKAFAKYEDLSPLEILRRLRTAEWNAQERGRDRDGWKAAAQRLQQELDLAERKLATYPPDGYTLPKVVADLIDHAKAHGWKTAVSWRVRPEGFEDVLLTVRMGRVATPADGETRGTRWEYKLSWSCIPGSARKNGSGLARTPDRPAWHDAPSVKQVREVIAANPKPTELES